jgi:Dullard-like phosphatase family protein
MDDTLTLMTLEPLKSSTDNCSPRAYDAIVTAQGNPIEWGMVYFRPFLRSFLETVSAVFEVVVFTAACQDYADQILDAIDPCKRLIHHRLYRDSCKECTPNPELPEAKVYVKDLACLGRDVRKTILIDNSLLSFAYQLNNGVVCNPYTGDENDTELLVLLEVLNQLLDMSPSDVRSYFSKKYGVQEMVREYSSRGGREGVKQDYRLSAGTNAPMSDRGSVVPILSAQGGSRMHSSLDPYVHKPFAGDPFLPPRISIGHPTDFRSESKTQNSSFIQNQYQIRE